MILREKLKNFFKKNNDIEISLYELQKKYNVSRQPVVNALKKMKRDKIIKVIKTKEKGKYNKNQYIYIGG